MRHVIVAEHASDQLDRGDAKMPYVALCLDCPWESQEYVGPLAYEAAHDAGTQHASTAKD